MPNPHICPICGKGKGGANHATCSKVLQAQHLASKKKSVPKRLVKNHIDYLTNTGTK